MYKKISDSIRLKLRQSSVGNYLNQKVRDLRSSKKITSKKGKSSKNSKGLPKLVFKLNPRKYLLTIFAALITIFIIFNLSIYISINPKPLLKEDLSASMRITDTKEMNVVFLGFEDRLNNYKFLDMIVIASVNSTTGEIRTYGINPNFIVSADGNKFTLKTAFNLLQSDEKYKMDDLLSKIEKIIGVRLDRYIAFNYSDLQKIINVSNLSMTAVNSKKTAKAFYNENDHLNGEGLVDYLINNDKFEDSTLQRYVFFINYYLDSLRNTFSIYKTFVNSSQILSIFYTNFDRNELIKFYLNISNSSGSFKTGYTLKNFTVDLPDEKTNGIISSDILVDEDVAKIFSSLNIVKEQSKLEIYNATEKSGIAYQKKRMYSNLGATVIKTGNYPKKLDENTLYIPKSNPELFQETIKMIQTDLGDVKIVLGDYDYNYSGDLILVIGKL